MKVYKPTVIYPFVTSTSGDFSVNQTLAAVVFLYDLALIALPQSVTGKGLPGKRSSYAMKKR